MAISDAVGADRVSTVLGYKLGKGNFATSTPNLPQRILVIGVPNTGVVVPYDQKEQHLTARSVGDRYGFGSPMHSVMRILKPLGSDGIGGIPVFFCAQEEVGTAGVTEVTVTGTATINGTLDVRVGGRSVLDGGSYAVNYAIGDTADAVMGALRDAINSVPNSPVTATFVSGTDTEVTVTSKFKGLNSSIDVSIFGASGSGFTIAKNVTDGTGAPAVTNGLQSMGDEWFTMVINTYDPRSTTVLDELQAFNGRPSDTPTGRYSGINWRPFVALVGTCTQTQGSSFITYAQSNITEVTNARCPFIGSAGMCYEAAANVAFVESVLANNTPALDPINRVVPDMPAPFGIVSNDYDDRDFAVKNGASTSLWTGSGWQIKDLVTTYHDDSDIAPVFRYVRDLYIDFNMKFSYFLKQNLFALGRVLIPDDEVSPSGVNSISPKEWRALVMDLIDDFANRGMLVDRQFSYDSIQVEIDPTNPNRLNTAFSYKRSGIVRIGSTNVLAGFYFGTTVG